LTCGNDAGPLGYDQRPNLVAVFERRQGYFPYCGKAFPFNAQLCEYVFSRFLKELGDLVGGISNGKRAVTTEI
jgi:hypothetical protein